MVWVVPMARAMFDRCGVALDGVRRCRRRLGGVRIGRWAARCADGSGRGLSGRWFANPSDESRKTAVSKPLATTQD